MSKTKPCDCYDLRSSLRFEDISDFEAAIVRYWQSQCQKTCEWKNVFVRTEIQGKDADVYLYKPCGRQEDGCHFHLRLGRDLLWKVSAYTPANC